MKPERMKGEKAHMKQIAQPTITSCSVTWDDCGLGCSDDIRRVVTRILQTEIQVRFFNGQGDLIGGRIWPVSNQQKTELFDCNGSTMMTRLKYATGTVGK